MISIEGIRLSLNQDESCIPDKIIRILRVTKEDIIESKIIKKSVDARDQKRVIFLYNVHAHIKNEESVLCQNFPNKFRVQKATEYSYTYPKTQKGFKFRPVIVGSGPCGLFAALVLAKSGCQPILIERGKDVDSRINDVSHFFSKGELNTESNVQFGEGGAGTFSDGKLYTLINDPRTQFIFQELIHAGAPPEIAYDAKPHIGTDRLRQVVKNLREKIIATGGEIRFQNKLTNIKIENGKLESIIVNDDCEIKTDILILAIGHSARDTVEILLHQGLKMQPKPFSMGVRIEHKKLWIDEAQYGAFAKHPKLPAGKYKLVAHLPNGRHVYTFCMCPGGVVVGAASETDGVVTNGMSTYAQDGENSNSAILVNVTPEDFRNHPLNGIHFQKTWERKAHQLGGNNYAAPVQLVKDFVMDCQSDQFGKVKSTYQPSVQFARLSKCLPVFVSESIKAALPIFAKKIKGFSHPDAVLTGVETRSSSPVRIWRNEQYESNISGIFPAGEGAGYAGGIISSAVDGIKVAEMITTRNNEKKNN